MSLGNSEINKVIERENGVPNVDYLVGDITDPKTVGKNTAIVIPGNTSLHIATDFYPNGVQSALLNKTSENLLNSARQTINEIYGPSTLLNNGDMVLVETSRVTGSESWNDKVPSSIIFAVTMEPDDETMHKVTQNSVADTIGKVLGSADQLNVSDIAFPLIGTGAMGLSFADFFAGFKRGVDEYANTHVEKNIKNIKVVIHPSDKPRLLSQLPNLQLSKV